MDKELQEEQRDGREVADVELGERERELVSLGVSKQGVHQRPAGLAGTVAAPCSLKQIDGMCRRTT